MAQNIFVQPLQGLPRVLCEACEQQTAVIAVGLAGGDTFDWCAACTDIIIASMLEAAQSQQQLTPRQEAL